MDEPDGLLVAIGGNAKEFQRAGHFARGSMGPKVEAAIRHIEGGGRRAIIGHLERAADALSGAGGTHVVAD